MALPSLIVGHLPENLATSQSLVFFNPSAYLIAAIGLWVSIALYNVYFHPLRSYPGPWLARATWLYNAYFTTRGQMPAQTHHLHLTYGEVVRIAPNALTFNTAQAWEEIYGRRRQSMVTGKGLLKDSGNQVQIPGDVGSLVFASEEDHRRQRRVLANAFSDKALMEQEAIIQSHVDNLVNKLHQYISHGEGTSVDMTQWMSAAFFDITTDLSFGRSFGCLENSNTLHPWCKAVAESIKQITIYAAIRRLFPSSLFSLADSALMSTMNGAMIEAFQFAADEAKRRVARGSTQRKDFFHYILRAHETDKGMSLMEIESAATVIVAAGSETTATLVCNTIYLLCSHSNVLQRLTEEIRSRFTSDCQITFSTARELSYLKAVLEESLRYTCPVPLTLARVVPTQGAVICGRFVPEGTVVGVNQVATNRSPKNFVEPETFKPERWMGDVEFAGDDRDACKPFSHGSRNCIGKNLAYAQATLILARLLLNFEPSIDSRSHGWLERQKSFITVEMPPLHVKLQRVQLKEVAG